MNSARFPGASLKRVKWRPTFPGRQVPRDTSEAGHDDWRTAGTSLLIAGLLTATWFQLVGRLGFNLMDEGFLWYGAARTALGEIPLRDFQSYEPGRYYWIAAWACSCTGLGSTRVNCMVCGAFCMPP